MKIIFDSNITIYLLTLVFIILSFLLNLKLYSRKEYNNNFLNSDTAKSLKGICCIMVVLCHIANRMVNVGFMKPFSIVGAYAVGIFFFLSGYGLMYSYLTKNNYLKHFIKKKVLKIYIIFVVINILTVIA